MKLSPVISISEFINIYNNQDVLVFDASNTIEAKNNYQKEHIRGAIFVDVNSDLADIKKCFSDGGRHPLPNINDFKQTLQKFGVNPQKHIVIYDNQHGSNAAARFWWMLKAIGHTKVQILDGEFLAVKEYQIPLSSEQPVLKPTSYEYEANEWLLPTIDYTNLKQKIVSKQVTLIDVRSKERFKGHFEPIDLVAGHIPTAINIPFTDNLTSENLFKTTTELKSKYKDYLGKVEDVIIYCGSGVTACHTLLAFDYAGLAIPTLYVGSWSEWSRRE